MLHVVEFKFHTTKERTLAEFNKAQRGASIEIHQTTFE
jgi:hypothetical protein